MAQGLRIPRNRITQRFADSGIEAEYQQEFAAINRQNNRVGAYMAAAAWYVSALGIFLMQPDRGPSFLIAALAQTPLFILSVIASHSRRSLTLSRWVAMTINLASGAGLIYIGAYVYNDSVIFALGLVTVVFFAPFILRLGYHFSLASTLVNVAAGMAVVAAGHRFAGDDVPVLIVGLGLSWFAGATGAYLLERSDRRVFELRRELEDTNARLRHETYTDDLTGLHTRQFFFELLEAEVDAARRYRTPLALAMLDLDLFKRINDELGHLTGDDVLSKFADLIRQTFRKSDIAARYGGEEFILLFRNTGLTEASSSLNRFLEHVRGVEFKDVPWDLTFSAGVVELSDHFDSVALAKAADDLLLAAKDSGRNRVLTST